ncbi:MAG: hypothetical protein OHK0050_38890 [Roseiflexaceae bacterium]
MTPQRLAELRDDEFDALIEQHIDRVASGASDPPIEDALAVWLDRLASQVSTTTTLEVAITGGQVSVMPAAATDQVLVRGNEIIIGKHRIVLQPMADVKS